MEGLWASLNIESIKILHNNLRANILTITVKCHMFNG